MKTLIAAMLLCAPIIAQASEPAADPDKKTCRSEQVTGSMFPKRVCHTKAEWAALDVEAQRAAEHMQNQSRGNGVDVPR